MKNRSDFERVLRDVSCPPWSFRVWTHNDVALLQAFMLGHDNVTGEGREIRGRKFYLSPHATDSEVVQTALLAVLVASEHETRERFSYRGQAVLHPHYDLAQLADLLAAGAIEGLKPDLRDPR